MDTAIFSLEFEVSGPVFYLLWALLVVTIAGFSAWWALSKRGSTTVVNQFASRLGLNSQSLSAELARRTIRRRWIFSAAGIGIVIAGLQLFGTLQGNAYLSLAVVAVALGTWFLFNALSKRLLNTSQPANTPEELLWSDALRTEALISYFQVIPLVSAWLTFLLLFGITTTTTTDGIEWSIASVGPVLLLLAAAAMLLMSLGSLVWRKPYQHYQRTLWADQQVAS